MELECSSWCLINDKSTLIEVTSWCRRPTSRYFNHCWPISMAPYGTGVPGLECAIYNIRINCVPCREVHDMERGLHWNLTRMPLTADWDDYVVEDIAHREITQSRHKQQEDQARTVLCSSTCNFARSYFVSTGLTVWSFKLQLLWVSILILVIIFDDTCSAKRYRYWGFSN